LEVAVDKSLVDRVEVDVGSIKSVSHGEGKRDDATEEYRRALDRERIPYEIGFEARLRLRWG
jgi:hypothetical protein